VKQARQGQKRRAHNRSKKQALKDALKEIRTAEDKAGAEKLLSKVQSVIDRSARHHIVNRNTARRMKSRVARELAEKA